MTVIIARMINEKIPAARFASPDSRMPLSLPIIFRPIHKKKPAKRIRNSNDKAKTAGPSINPIFP